ncbi:MAG: DUF5702 domain-containing protein [Clostridiales bacterium]
MVSFGREEIKKYRSFIDEDTAAITVYFLLAGSALILLLLALFNFGRFLMARQQAATALEASAASVLSHYQTDLVREMGLFALDTRDAAGLQAAGKTYFTANLGEPGAINSQKCLIYALSFPEESRLNQEEILTIQAVDSQRIEGWFKAGQDILNFLGLTDWQSLLKSWLSSGTGEEALDHSGLEDWADWHEDENGQATGTEQEGGGSAAVRLWHFFLPWPIHSGFANVELPEGIGNQAGSNEQRKKQLEELAAFGQGFSSLFGSKIDDEANQTAELPPGALEKIKIFLAGFQDSLSGVLAKGKDKLLFTEYLLQELDYATNKPAMERYFSRCEAEYVLWGYGNSWDNLRYTALQLFLLRSGFHLLASVINMEAVDEVTLAKEALQALVKGGLDVEKLFNGERIPAFPGQTKLTMSYKDHLRLFLICQKGTSQKQALQRLIQANLWFWQARNTSGSGQGLTGQMRAAEFGLSRYAAEVRVIAETKLSLWPFGATLIRREGVMGYDRPFALVS